MDDITESPASETIRVLIVDDEISILKVFKKVLDRAGFETQTALNGFDALACLEKHAFDIVITDIVMPEMDGIELIKRIKKKYNSDVIVVTGRTEDYQYDQLIQMGAGDFLKKPVDIQELVLRVKRVWNEIRLKKELIRYHKELAQAQKLESIGLLAAGIAHEINTPTQYIGDNTIFIKESFEELLNVVDHFRQCLDAARKGSLDGPLLDKMEAVLEDADVAFLAEEIPQAVEQTLEGVGRVRKIVRSMKEFSHPGAGEKSKVDIHHAIENTVTVAVNEWKYCADLTLDFDPDIPLIECDASEMSQVFLNLIINAAHAITEKLGKDFDKKGKITISTRKKDKWARIRITDTGTGIPDTIIEKVFDPFFTTKEVGKGTGQGLAISRSVVVDKHNGKLEIESKEGKGTSFIINIPFETLVK